LRIGMVLVCGYKYASQSLSHVPARPSGQAKRPGILPDRPDGFKAAAKGPPGGAEIQIFLDPAGP
jgi:hypothetical protein